MEEDNVGLSEITKINWGLVRGGSVKSRENLSKNDSKIVPFFND